jgi:V/A-type H+-transporting ATPase subunit E
MEAHLQELLDKIRDEGVKEADRKAARIIKEAEDKAAGLISRARAEAEKTAAESEQKTAQAVARGEEALRQAGRDLLLKLRERVSRLFDHLLRRELRTALDGKLLPDLAGQAVAAFNAAGKKGVELQVAAKDAERLEKHLRAALSAELAKGLTITPLESIDAGFRIGEKDGTVYHDITDAGLAEILGAFVNPRLAEILREAAGLKGGNP